MLVTMVTPLRGAGRQHRAHPLGEQRIVAGSRIVHPAELRQGDGALGQALEDEVVEPPVLGELHGRLDPIAGVAGAAADPDRRPHSGNTPKTIAAATISSDAANSHGAVKR